MPSYLNIPVCVSLLLLWFYINLIIPQPTLKYFQGCYSFESLQITLINQEHSTR